MNYGLKTFQWKKTLKSFSININIKMNSCVCVLKLNGLCGEKVVGSNPRTCGLLSNVFQLFSSIVGLNSIAFVSHYGQHMCTVALSFSLCLRTVK